MPVTRTMGYQFLTEEAEGAHNLENDSLIVCLMDTSFAFDPAVHSTYADISASEIATGFGYTQKTKALTNVASTETATGTTVSCDNVTWTASGGNMPAIGAAVVINDTHANDTVVCCIDFGADYTTLDGTVFQIDFSNGLFTKTNGS